MMNAEMPDAYLSENLPAETSLPAWKKAVYETTYGNDMKTQPLCPECGRPMYYGLNRRTGLIELSCACRSVNESKVSVHENHTRNCQPVISSFQDIQRRKHEI